MVSGVEKLGLATGLTVESIFFGVVEGSGRFDRVSGYGDGDIFFYVSIMIFVCFDGEFVVFFNLNK